MIRQETLARLNAAVEAKKAAEAEYAAARTAVLAEDADDSAVEQGPLHVKIDTRFRLTVTMAAVAKILGKPAAALLKASLKPQASVYVTLVDAATDKPVRQPKTEDGGARPDAD